MEKLDAHHTAVWIAGSNIVDCKKLIALVEDYRNLQMYCVQMKSFVTIFDLLFEERSQYLETTSAAASEFVAAEALELFAAVEQNPASIAVADVVFE